MLDQDHINNLSNEQRGVYAAFASLFDAPGWHLFVEDVTKSLDEVQQRIDNAPSWDDYNKAHGYRTAMRKLRDYQETIEREFRSMAEWNHDQARQAEEADHE